MLQMMAERSPFDNMNQNRPLCTPSTFAKESQDIIRDLLEKMQRKELDVSMILVKNKYEIIHFSSTLIGQTLEMEK